jgi:hypothetical protein
VRGLKRPLSYVRGSDRGVRQKQRPNKHGDAFSARHAPVIGTHSVIGDPAIGSQWLTIPKTLLSLDTKGAKQAVAQNGLESHFYFDGKGVGCQSLPHRDGVGPILNFNVPPD